jgi:hypothetical protein
VTFLHAQEKQKIPAEFFTSKWAGEIEKISIVISDHGNSEHIIFYQFENIKLHLPEQILPMYNANPSWFLKQMKHYYCKGFVTISGKLKHTHIDRDYCEECRGKGVWSHVFKPITVPATIEFSDNGIEINFDELSSEYTLIKTYPNSPVGGTIVNPLALGRLHIAYFDHSNIKIEYEKQYAEGDHYIEKYSQRGTLYKVEVKKLFFPKDIKPSEAIKTDKKTQLEITIPDVSKVNVAPNTEARIKCSICWLEVGKGKIHGLIKKLRPKTKFEVKTPTSAFSVRGTEYTVEVQDDGTTTVVVLEGEVEFSDKVNKKTVNVKKNQMSVCRPNGLPSDPNGINQDQLLKWWK